LDRRRERWWYCFYYISSYPESHRFHTKHTLIYSFIREKKRISKERIIRTGRKSKKIEIIHKMRRKTKDRSNIIHKMCSTRSVTLPDGNWTLSRASVTSREKKLRERGEKTNVIKVIELRCIEVDKNDRKEKKHEEDKSRAKQGESNEVVHQCRTMLISTHEKRIQQRNTC
jgi:hypothetical protein